MEKAVFGLLPLRKRREPSTLPSREPASLEPRLSGSANMTDGLRLGEWGLWCASAARDGLSDRGTWAADSVIDRSAGFAASLLGVVAKGLRMFMRLVGIEGVHRDRLDGAGLTGAAVAAAMLAEWDRSTQ